VVYALGVLALLSLVKVYVLIRGAHFEWTKGAEYLERLGALPASRQGDLLEHYKIRDELGASYQPFGAYTYGFWQQVVRPTLSQRSIWLVRLEGLCRFALSIYVLTPLSFAFLVAESSRFRFGQQLSDWDWWAGIACIFALLLLQLTSAVGSSVGQLALGGLAADYVGYRTGIKDPVTRILDRAAAFVGSLLFFFMTVTAALTWGASRMSGFPSMSPPEVGHNDWLVGMGDGMYSAVLLILGLQNAEASDFASRLMVSVILITGASFLVAALGILWGSLQSQSDALRTVAFNVAPAPTADPAPMLLAQPVANDHPKVTARAVVSGLVGAAWLGYCLGSWRRRRRG